MTLLTCYEAAIGRGELIDDPLQREVLVSMQRLADDLQKSRMSWFPRKHTSRGLYLYGSVGAGKTYLVDLFYQQLRERKKRRFHFHHFMQQVDIKLRKIQGTKNPLQRIAKDLAKTTRVICFDEFLVHDVAYAMILAELLQALMNRGVVLVISSNTRPDDLYLNGVQRARFIPAIQLLKTQCEILHLDKKRDYRLGLVPILEAWLCPLNENTQKIMQQQFDLCGKNSEENGLISVQNRKIQYVKRSSRSIWFDFNQICTLPRSKLDYLEIADQFDTVFLSGIPVFTEHHATQILMFIHLVDVLYDRGVKLVSSSEITIDELNKTGVMKEEFKRTASRLNEMQSSEYLMRHPRRAVDLL